MNKKEMKRNEIIQEILASVKAQEILDNINAFLKTSGDTIGKQDLLNIIHAVGDTNEYYTQPDD